MLNPNLAPEEITSRFLRQSGHYTPSTGRIKWQAFRPAPADHQTSVFRIHGLTDCQVWAIADEYCALPIGHTIDARAELSIELILKIGLQILPAEPPPRHANITKWPIEKKMLMLLAQQLADGATLRLRQQSTSEHP